MEELALEIAQELRRHGGHLEANHLPAIRPDVRKRLGDTKLLQFLQSFPHLVEIHERHGGHLLRIPEQTRSKTSQPLGQAPGATRRGPAERAVHALRALEREVQRSCELRWVEVSYLLHNGKIRRKIGAVVRFHPVQELIMQDVEEGNEDKEMPLPVRGCPVSAHARTCAGYLLQFLQDRPEKFELLHGGSY